MMRFESRTFSKRIAMEIEKIKSGKNLLETSLFEPTLITHKDAIITHKRSMMGTFTNNAPTMPRKGRRTKIIETAKTLFVSPLVPSEEAKFPDKSCLYPAKNIIKVNADTAVVNGIIERGCEKPRISYNSLTKNPNDIVTATLRPKDSKTMPRKLISLSLRIFRRTKPGMNDK